MRRGRGRRRRRLSSTRRRRRRRRDSKLTFEFFDSGDGSVLHYKEEVRETCNQSRAFRHDGHHSHPAFTSGEKTERGR